MSDNVNIIVQDTINEIVVNSAVTVETIDINVQAAVDEVTIIANPNDYIINVNRIIGEQVQSDWNETDINAPDFIKNKPFIPTNTSDLINDGEDGINPFITLNDIPPVTGFVPYTGATQDVNLGEFGIQLGNLEFDTTPTNAPTGVGSMVWNDTAGTLDLKLKGGAVTLQIGQETVARVVNKTATNITLLEANYQIVRVTGAQGQRPKVDLALANNDLNSTTTLGLVTETILNNQEGFITTSGQVQGINTTGSLQGETWADGDVLYLSGTVAGQATNIKPIAPIHTVIVGFVEYAHITQGKIFVKVDNGYELEELHNVSAIAPNNNEVLTYDSATLLWKPKTVFQLPTLTNGSVLFSNGTTIAQDNSNFFWDNTNKRLGIGITVPLYTLDITGSAGATARFKGAGQSTVSLNDGTNENYLVGIGGAIRLAPSGSTALTVLGNGNVLIGTTVNQGGKLQIKAPGALSTDIALRVRNSTDTGDIFTTTGQGDSYINTLRIGRGASGLSDNTVFGYQSGDAITTGNFNTLMGYQAGKLLTTGAENTFIGRLAGAKATTANQNIAIGQSSGWNLTTGTGANTFIGVGSGYSTTTGAGNVAIGHSSYKNNLTGGSNVAVGYGALESNLSNWNTAIGSVAQQLSTNSSGNVSLGYATLRHNTTGSFNIALGMQAGQFNSTGNLILSNNSIFIGYLAKALADGQTNQIVIGDQAIGIGSNSVVLGNDSIVTTALRGNVGIGTTAPVASAKVQIDSTTQGFLPPRMTNAQRTAIATPAVGLCVYCTDAVEGLYINKSTGWTYIG